MHWAFSRNELKTAYKLCIKATQFLTILIQDCPLFSLPLCSQIERKKFTVIYNISDYFQLVSKSKTVKTVSALTPGKELLVLLDRGLTGPQSQPRLRV